MFHVVKSHKIKPCSLHYHICNNCVAFYFFDPQLFRPINRVHMIYHNFNEEIEVGKRTKTCEEFFNENATRRKVKRGKKVIKRKSKDEGKN